MANLVSTGQKCLQHIYFPSPCIHYNTSKCCHIAAVIDIHKEICTFYCSSFCVVMFVVQTRWGYQLEKSKTSMNPKNMMQNQHYKLMWVHFPCFCILFSSNRSMTEYSIKWRMLRRVRLFQVVASMHGVEPLMILKHHTITKYPITYILWMFTIQSKPIIFRLLTWEVILMIKIWEQSQHIVFISDNIQEMFLKP